MNTPSRTSGRRSDATRNVESILDAAVGVLSARPEASMSEIAKASGLSRQTVYSHFPSRESLLTAVADRARNQALSAIDEAIESSDDPGGQLSILIPSWWGAVADHANVLGVLGSQLGHSDGAAIHDFHEPILERLEDLVRRGQDSGQFDQESSPAWLSHAFLGLVHAAAEEVAHERMTGDQALAALEVSIPRVFGVNAAIAPAQ